MGFRVLLVFINKKKQKQHRNVYMGSTVCDRPDHMSEHDGNLDAPSCPGGKGWGGGGAATEGCSKSPPNSSHIARHMAQVGKTPPEREAFPAKKTYLRSIRQPPDGTANTSRTSRREGLGALYPVLIHIYLLLRVHGVLQQPHVEQYVTDCRHTSSTRPGRHGLHVHHD